MAKRAKGTGTLRKEQTEGGKVASISEKMKTVKISTRLLQARKKSECQNKLDKLIAEEEKENAMRIASMVIVLIRLLKNGIESTSKIFAQDT